MGWQPSRRSLALFRSRVARTWLRLARCDCQTVLVLPRRPHAAAMAHSLRPVASPADADDNRQFTAADAQRVYALAREDSRLGTKVREALDIVERALDEYGCVLFRRTPPSATRRNLAWPFLDSLTLDTTRADSNK